MASCETVTCRARCRPTVSYIIEDNVCYLTLCDRDYPKRLAFAFLNDVHQGFQEELKKESGDAWRDSIETADRPYKFIKFDKFIQRQRKAYSDPSSGPNTARLNDDLLDIHAIMKKNIQEVLNRGEQLDRECSHALLWWVCARG